MPLLTLVTDFGLRDPYVGEMKGVLLQVAPDLSLVDLTHGVAPGNVREGAWILRKSWELFPPGTCHLAVVDPGVGGERLPIAAFAGGHYFVGPDNGLLTPALESAGGDWEIREITLREIDRPRRGTTFDGRDVFAPTAARIATGMPLREVGPERRGLAEVASFAPASVGRDWELEVVRVDRFGNLITNGEETFLRETFGEDWRGVSVEIGDRTIEGIRVAYEECDAGEPLLSIGSCGTLEVSVNRGSARDRFDLRPGSRVLLRGPNED
jgi:S-adenosylmethionine hydrolase